jgi:hypothetical protein
VRSAPLRALVEEILAETVLGGVVLGRLAESAVAWDLITNGIRAARGVRREAEEKEEEEARRREKAAASRLDQFGLLSDPGRVEDEKMAAPTFAQTASSAGTTLLAALNYGLLLLLALRAVVPALIAAKTLPPRTTTTTTTMATDEGKPPRAVLEMGAWGFAASFTELRERMPWLAGLLALAQQAAVDGPAAVGGADGRLDRSVSSSFFFPIYLPISLATGPSPSTHLARFATDGRPAKAASTEQRRPACAFHRLSIAS